MSTRAVLYAAARLLGDVQAAQRGPAPFARRQVRKAVWRGVARLLRGA